MPPQLYRVNSPKSLFFECLVFFFNGKGNFYIFFNYFFLTLSSFFFFFFFFSIKVRFVFNYSSYSYTSVHK